MSVTVRTADGYPPVWTLRASVIPNDMLFEFSVFAGGLACPVDLAGPPARRPRRLDLRLRGLRGRPAPVRHPRPPHSPQ
jgi:hypothetical protein